MFCFFKKYFSEIFAAIFIALNIVYCIAFVMNINFSGTLSIFLLATPVFCVVFAVGLSVSFFNSYRLKRSDKITVLKRPPDLQPKENLGEFFNLEEDITTFGLQDDMGKYYGDKIRVGLPSSGKVADPVLPVIKKGKPFIQKNKEPDYCDDSEKCIKPSVKKNLTVQKEFSATLPLIIPKGLSVIRGVSYPLVVPESVEITLEEPEEPEPNMLDEIPVADYGDLFVQGTYEKPTIADMMINPEMRDPEAIVVKTYQKGETWNPCHTDPDIFFGMGIERMTYEEKLPVAATSAVAVSTMVTPVATPMVITTQILPEPDNNARVYYRTRSEALSLRKPGDRIYRKPGRGMGYYIVTPKTTR